MGTHIKIDQKDVDQVLDYINAYWHRLRRTGSAHSSTIIPLPHPYLVPSSSNQQFSFEEQYYWDTYFIALGIDDEHLVSGMLDNLIHMFDQFGLIPNGNRYYFTSRSQPPILTSLIFHIFEKYDKPASWLQEKIAVAKREYETVWTSQSHPNDRNVFKGMSRYYDINYLHDLAEAESGWDMTPRFKRQCLDYIPIDLNCLLYKYEMDFAQAAAIMDDKTEETFWQKAARERAQTVTNYLWNERAGFFFDYNYVEKERSKVWSLAAYYALWSGLATQAQAEKMIDRLERFEKPGGLTTTIGNYMYFALFGSAKTQWAYPNGWAPLHFIVTEGLERYGSDDYAKKIGLRWLKTCTTWYAHHGELLEKYNVITPEKPPAEGLYPSQSGFAWTNSIYVYYAHKYFKQEQS